MKIHIENTSITLDIDPEDLSDESLRQCMTVAALRGLAPTLSGTAGELQLAIERAFAALINGNPVIAVAQLQPFVGRDKQTQAIQSGIMTARSTRNTNAAIGIRPNGRAADPAKLPQP